MMKLSSYTPVGNDILLEVRETSKSPKGIILPSPQRDRVMKVLKVGSVAQEVVKPGEWVLVGPNFHGVEFPVLDDTGTKMYAFQGSIHGIIGIYDKDETVEDKVFMMGDEGPEIEVPTGPSNIIDNPGIEKGSFLKEQTDLLN